MQFLNVYYYYFTSFMTNNVVILIFSYFPLVGIEIVLESPQFLTTGLSNNIIVWLSSIFSLLPSLSCLITRKVVRKELLQEMGEWGLRKHVLQIDNAR